MSEMQSQTLSAEYIYEEPAYLRGYSVETYIFRFRVRETIYVIHRTLRRGRHEPINQEILLGCQIGGRDYAFSHVPYEDDQFIWVARQLTHGREASIAVLVQGERVPVALRQLRPVDSLSMIGPVWCPIANMTSARPYGRSKELLRGSKHFAAGAKLYCFPYLWGDGYEQIQVIGRHRATHRYVTMIVSSKWLVNWRVGLAYSPLVIDQLWPRWDGTERSKAEAEDIVADMSRQSETRDV